MKTKFAVFVGAAMLAACSASAAPVGSVESLAREWALQNGKPVVWEAGSEYATRTIALESQADASTPKGLQAAFESLRALLSRAGMEPLKACVFTNAIEIRRESQPDCRQPR